MARWIYTPRFAASQVKQALASSETIAQLKSIATAKRAARTETPKLDVFGNPIDKVSPRVQRIRDLQAGKRVIRGTYAHPVTKAAPKDTRSFEEQSSEMFDKINKAIEDGEV